MKQTNRRIAGNQSGDTSLRASVQETCEVCGLKFEFATLILIKFGSTAIFAIQKNIFSCQTPPRLKQR